MTTWNDYFPSKWLSASDLDEPRKLTITHISEEDLRDGRKPVAHFKEEKKALILNKTNSEFLKIFSKSENPDDCRGLVVMLVPVELNINGETKMGLRFRRVPADGGPVAHHGATVKEKKPKLSLADDLDDGIPF
jgi:hypothetical protein